MTKTAFLFPGQGSQCAGMGKSLYENFQEVRDLFALGSEVLGKDLKELLFTAPEEELSETKNSQPAIFTVSLAAAELLAARGVQPGAVCGFSLGEVPALTFAGILSRKDGFRVIRERAQLMQEAADKSSGGMCAVLGLAPEAVEEVCKETAGYVVPVNYNSPKQTVIAGEDAALAAACEALLARGAMRAVRLKVNAAFHSALMQDAAEKLAKRVSDVPAGAPQTCVYTCVDAEPVSALTGIADYFRRQMVSPVRFQNTVERMIADGYTDFIEVGTGNVLTGLVKRIDKTVSCRAVGDLESLAKVLEG